MKTLVMILLLTLSAFPQCVGTTYATPQQFGAVEDDTLPDNSAIQQAVNNCLTVLIPRGAYWLDSSIYIRTGQTILGDGMGASIFKVKAGKSVTLISAISKSRWTVRDLGFDNSLNYPNDTTTSPNQGIYKGDSFTFKVNSAIIVSDGGDDWSISGCRFVGISGYSIRAREGSYGYHRVKISGNIFLRGGYCGRAISIEGATNNSDHCKSIVVDGNIIDSLSVNKYVLLGIGSQNASTEGIKIKRTNGFTLTNNTIRNTAGAGIIIERTSNGIVSGNAISEPGQDGIAIYNSSFGIVVSGNSINNFGRIPNFGSLRSYSGKYYIARETPTTTGPKFPADPSTSTWIDSNIYDFRGVSTSSIPAYDTNNYYSSTTFLSLPDSGDITNPNNFKVASDQGVLPFRGYAGVSVSQFSERIIITSNRIVGDLTKVSGLYKYASDFGISTVHSTNLPQAYNSPVIAFNNIISGTIKAEIYQPGWCDPINSKGKIDSVITYPYNYRVTAGGKLQEITY